MLSLDVANFPPAETVKMLARLLDQMTKANDKLKAVSSAATSTPTTTPSSQPNTPPSNTHTPHSTNAPTSAFTRFHARSIPTIDIYSYLQRVLKYCPCANECFLSLLVYFDRMSRHYSLAHPPTTVPRLLEHQNKTGIDFAIDSYNVHRLLISGIMIAAKYFSDVFFTNSRYAKVGGLPVAELNHLEIEFLRLNDFAIAVSIEELQRYGDLLLRHSLSDPQVRRSLIEARLVPPSVDEENWGFPNMLPLYPSVEGGRSVAVERIADGKPRDRNAEEELARYYQKKEIQDKQYYQQQVQLSEIQYQQEQKQRQQQQQHPSHQLPQQPQPTWNHQQSNTQPPQPPYSQHQQPHSPRTLQTSFPMGTRSDENIRSTAPLGSSGGGFGSPQTLSTTRTSSLENMTNSYQEGRNREGSNPSDMNRGPQTINSCFLMAHPSPPQNRPPTALPDLSPSSSSTTAPQPSTATTNTPSQYTYPVPYPSGGGASVPLSL